MAPKKVPQVGLTRLAAAQVILDHGVTAFPVDPMAIARACDITVEAKPAEHNGFSGMLARVGENFGILYATHIPSPGFQRFSVAHELGHYFLAGHVDQLLELGAHVSRAGFVTSDPYEMEADLFASALLLPDKLFAQELQRASEGLDGVIEIADLAQTSLTATAIALVQHTREATAVVQSLNGIVEFCTFSDAMKEAGVRWLRKGDLVPGGSVTDLLAKNPAAVRSGQRRFGSTRLSAWFDNGDLSESREDAVGLGPFGRVLTLITSDRISFAADGYDDEPDEAELIESWTPRFRR